MASAKKAAEAVARAGIEGKVTDTGYQVEIAIRAYDPCLSCATHAMGQMPLMLEVRDAAGKVIAEHVKEAA